MTYSNRSEGSPFQHRSEFDKSPPKNDCLKENPYWKDPPGAWSASYPYGKPAAPPKNADKGLDDPEPSPICEWATTWGDNTVSVCNPPYEFAPKVSCPMSRPLEPQRRIDPGMWVYNKEEAEKKRKNAMTENKYIIPGFILLLTLMSVYHCVLRKK